MCVCMYVSMWVCGYVRMCVFLHVCMWFLQVIFAKYQQRLLRHSLITLDCGGEQITTNLTYGDNYTSLHRHICSHFQYKQFQGVKIGIYIGNVDQYLTAHRIFITIQILTVIYIVHLFPLFCFKIIFYEFLLKQFFFTNFVFLCDWNC